MATVKAPFYVGKPDSKYSILKNPIGVDTDTSFLSTRTIDPSTSISLTPLSAAVSHLWGKKVDFDFTVSPNSLIDWDNSVCEIRMKFANALGTGVVTACVLPWNLLLFFFEEVQVWVNGQSVFSKTSGDYGPTQTMKIISEHTHESINASTCVFAPVGDEFYQVGVIARPAITAASSPKSGWRGADWLTSTYTDDVVKNPTFKDLFYSIGGGLSKNTRTVKMSFTLKSSIPLAKALNIGDGFCYPNNFRLHLHEYNFSSSTSANGLDEKFKAADEHIAFIDVKSRKVAYSSDMSVTSQKNIQWVAVAQFANEVPNFHTSSAPYENCGQTLLFNGYSSVAAVAGTVLDRSDNIPTGGVCIAPPSSAQVQVGGYLYPYNAMRLTNASAVTLLDHSEIYREYCRAVKRLSGILTPAIDEATFKRTMPFIFVKPTANNKLLQSSDIVVRLPGFSGSANTATKEVRIMWGELVGWNISASGGVNEAVSSF